MVVGLGALTVGQIYGIGAGIATHEGNHDKAAQLESTSENLTLFVFLPCDLVGLCLYFIHTSHLNKSIEVFNKTNYKGQIKKGTLYYGIIGNGVGVKLRF